MSAATHLVFITKPTGYELAERGGDPPPAGSAVDLEGNGGTFKVAKVASSPLPGDERRCAYLVPA
jgi:hypothetical protein